MPTSLALTLKDYKASNAVTVFHLISYKGNRFKISTSKNIEPKHWDKKAMKVKRTKPNFNEYNAMFKRQQNEIERIILKMETSNKEVTKENLKVQLNWVVNTKTGSNSMPINVFELHFIKEHGKGKAAQTIKTYTSTLNYLKKYETACNYLLSFSHFNKDFYEDFRQKLALKNNTFGVNIKILKTFLKWANENGYIDTNYFEKWKVLTEDGKDQFHLKFDEIKTIEGLELSGTIAEVRDLFLIGCYTGLRFSDLDTLEPIHYQDSEIVKTTLKTKAKVRIPVIAELKTLLEKYWNDSKMLPKISSQKGNEYLKKIGRLAKITRAFNYEQQKGSSLISTEYEGCEMMSWHVARHSFVTVGLQRGIAPNVIQQIVGHKSLKMMQRYTQKDTEHNKKEMMKLSSTPILPTTSLKNPQQIAP